MNKYKISFTLETAAFDAVHAFNQVKKSIKDRYGDRIKITDGDFEVMPVYKVGMGSVWRREGNLYAIVSTGPGVEKPYVLARLKDGCWTTNGTVDEIVANMTRRKSGWVLVKAANSFGPITWRGKVALEDLSL